MPVRFSDLKRMSLSPAHYRASEEESFETTRNMRIGSVTHAILLGPNKAHPIIRYEGETRRGKPWEAFEAAHRGVEIATQPEWEEGERIAESVYKSDVAMALIHEARHEVPLQWTDAGHDCATEGIDVVGRAWIADLKTTTCTQPDAFMRHATKMLYHCQMAWYETACKAHGLDTSAGIFLIGVESSLPYAVTVMRLTEATLAQGRKSLVLWLERLRACQENDHWPAYTQSIVDYDLPPWATDEGDDDG